MKILPDFLVNTFQNVTSDIESRTVKAKENLNKLKQKMDEDPQLKTAVFHAATYAACLLVPLAVGMYLSKINDDTINVWRTPDNVEKIEIVTPE